MNRVLTAAILLLTAFAADARFLNRDPAEGTTQNPPSLHKYLYAYQNPTGYVDPDGRTAEQFRALMTGAIEKYRTSGNRTAMGTAGELHLEKILKNSGEVIIKGPATRPGAHNADIVSYNPDTGKVTFFDNKIQTGKAAVSRAPNLSTDEGRAKSAKEALQKLDKMDLDASEYRKIQKALTEVVDNPSKGIWAIANASPDDLSEVDNKVKRVSERLAKKGVRFADIVGDKVNMLDKTKSVSNGKKAAKKVAKALPLLGTVAAGADAAIRADRAVEEDAAFRQAMRELGIGSTSFDHHSVEREAAIFAGEEAGGAGGAASGAALSAAPSAACGPAYFLCVGAGTLIGGLIGDSAGSAGSAAAFDKASESMAPGEMERIKQQIKERNSASPMITVETSRLGD